MTTAAMAWRLKFLVLIVLAVPAFSGYPLSRLPLGAIVPGISWSWTAYWLLVQIVVALLLGRPLYSRVLAASALLALPVVYGGAAVTFLGLQLGVTGGAPTAAGIHYTRLCMTMLTVVPLALAFVVVLPLDSFERSLLLRTDGLAAWQKKALMATRVFNHIAFGVIPGMLEVLREEQFPGRGRPARAAGPGARVGRAEMLRALIGDLVRQLVHLAVEGICAALQFIPLWAYEISRLPERPPRRKSGAVGTNYPPS